MATAGSPALKQWASIIKRWPIDKVRPESIAFQTVMQRRLDRVFSPSKVPPPAKVKGQPPVSPNPPVWNEQHEIKQAAALDSLLNNKYANAFPMPLVLRHPAVNPTHYDALVKELKEAPNRSWFAKFKNRILGGLRIK